MCKQNLKTNEAEVQKDASCHHDAAKDTPEQRCQFSDLLADLRLEQQELH